MTKDNAYAFAQFSVIGGHDYQGETFYSMRLFGDYESACDYARDLINKGYDYAYVAGIYADGTMGLKEVTRVADDEPSMEELEELPSGMTQAQAQANYEQALANLAIDLG